LIEDTDIQENKVGKYYAYEVRCCRLEGKSKVVNIYMRARARTHTLGTKMAIA